jgi:HPt (histidine-containing phosphotransfer) domain-containing protein
MAAAASVTTETTVTPTIDLERGLRSWGNAEVYYNYLRKFADAHGHDGDEIGALIAQKDLEYARALVHKLKGTAGNLAMMVVWEQAEKVERILTEGGEADNSAQILQMALDDVLAVIKTLTRTSASNDNDAISSVIDKDAARQILRDLLRALDRDNPDEAEPSLFALEKALPAHLLKPIREMLDNFDFRSAEEQTNALIKQLNINLEEV